MFNMGYGELLLVCALVFIFVKPEELPVFLRKAGTLYGRARRLISEARKFGLDVSSIPVEPEPVLSEPDELTKHTLKNESESIKDTADKTKTRPENEDDFLDVYKNPIEKE